jgi:hypothetical protein
MTFPSIRTIGAGFFASAGLAGLALGMAARPILGNLLAGIQIALAEPIWINDTVVVEGEFGLVAEINATYVLVRLWDLRHLIIPISYFRILDSSPLWDGKKAAVQVTDSKEHTVEIRFLMSAANPSAGSIFVVKFANGCSTLCKKSIRSLCRITGIGLHSPPDTAYTRILLLTPCRA